MSRATAFAAAAALIRSVKPATGICGRCRGKKFDLFTTKRSCRKCPACKGTGSVSVGGTKR